MTTIVYDGTTLASDSQVTSQGTRTNTAKKVFHFPASRYGEVLMGFTGELCKMEAFKKFLTDPAAPAPEGNYDALVVIKRTKELYLFDNSSSYSILQGNVTIGSGGDFALAALFLGYTSVQAVAVAIALDVNSGGGIQQLSFEVEGFYEDTE